MLPSHVTVLIYSPAKKKRREARESIILRPPLCYRFVCPPAGVDTKEKKRKEGRKKTIFIFLGKSKMAVHIVNRV